jgi:hypothetical protein
VTAFRRVHLNSNAGKRNVYSMPWPEPTKAKHIGLSNSTKYSWKCMCLVWGIGGHDHYGRSSYWGHSSRCIVIGVPGRLVGFTGRIFIKWGLSATPPQARTVGAHFGGYSGVPHTRFHCWLEGSLRISGPLAPSMQNPSSGAVKSIP